MRRVLTLLAAALPPPLNIVLLRTLGWRIGRGVRIGFGTVLLAREGVLGDGVRIGPLVYVRARSLMLGPRTTVGRLVKIVVHRFEAGPRVTLGTAVEFAGDPADDRSTVSLGEYCWVFQHAFVNVVRPVRMGRNVGVGGRSLIFTHGYWLSEFQGFPAETGPVTIGDDVWLPWDCFVMPGVEIGSRAVVAARSWIVKNVPADAVAGGVPARVIRDRSSRATSVAERMQILDRVFVEWTRRTGTAVDSREEDSRRIYLTDQRPLVIAHREVPSAPVPDVLNVYLIDVPAEFLVAHAGWCVMSQISSPEALLSPAHVAFLLTARTVGARYYPLVEC